MNTYNNYKLQNYFFLFLFVVAGIIMFRIFQPFISALILALVAAIVFEPVYRRLEQRMKGRAALAALLTVMFIICVILIPVTIIGGLLFNEARDLYMSLTTNSDAANVLITIVENSEEKLQRIIPDINLDIRGYLRESLGWTVGHLGAFFSGFISIVIGTIVMIGALYFLFKDGRKLRERFVNLSPLTNIYDEIILTKLTSSINAVVKGSLTVAIIQGVFTGLGFYIFGIPNPVLWGTAATITSLVPGLGPALIITPALLYLFYSGATGSMIGLLIWGIVAVGLVDDILKPYLINRDIKIHPFLVLLSVIGGILLFGPIGFILGPIALALFFALLEIYPLILKESEQNTK